MVVVQAVGVGGVVPKVHEARAVGMQQVQASAGADPEATRAVFEHGPHAVVTQAQRICGFVSETQEGPGPRVEPAQAAVVRADPQRALPILEDRADPSTTQAGRVVGIVMMHHKLARSSIEAVQAIVRSHPQISRAVGVDHEHAIVAEARPVVRLVMSELLGFRVEAVDARVASTDPDGSVPAHVNHSDVRTGQTIGGTSANEAIVGSLPDGDTTAGRADPEVSVLILVDRPNRIVSQGGRIRRVVLVDLEIVAVKAVQAVLGSDPQEPTTILENAGDGRLG